MRSTQFRSAILAAAALAAMSPVAAAAQDGNNTTDTTYDTRTVEREDNDFPWGLLGLLGLAGLLGRKKRDNDIHVDARHNNPRT